METMFPKITVLLLLTFFSLFLPLLFHRRRGISSVAKKNAFAMAERVTRRGVTMRADDDHDHEECMDADELFEEFDLDDGKHIHIHTDTYTGTDTHTLTFLVFLFPHFSALLLSDDLLNSVEVLLVCPDMLVQILNGCPEEDEDDWFFSFLSFFLIDSFFLSFSLFFGFVVSHLVFSSQKYFSEEISIGDAWLYSIMTCVGVSLISLIGVLLIPIHNKKGSSSWCDYDHFPFFLPSFPLTPSFQ